jgi:hypothetical protein
MALGEALTNLMWARVTALADVKASVNWMYAAKLGSEGAAMYDAAVALKCGQWLHLSLHLALTEMLVVRALRTAPMNRLSVTERQCSAECSGNFV